MQRMLRFGKRLVVSTLRGQAPRIGMILVRNSIRETSRKIRSAIWRKVVTKSLPKIAMDRRYFDLWETMGFHLIPIHFHQPIPDTRTLKAEIWNRKSKLIGIDMNVERQLELLTEVSPKFRAEYDFPRTRTNIPYEFYRQNGAFLAVDAEVFHCMIRHFQPSRIIEAGSGSTTYLAARACQLNMEKEGVKTELYAVDPFPNDVVRGGFPGLSALIQKPLEQVELDFFSQLGENDILFIDSSHVVQIGGDVNYAYLEIIPRLGEGVIVHVHDIFLPAEYPKKFVMKDHFFWTEQYVLHAFLSFNDAFEVLWSSSYMHLNYPDKLKSAFPSYVDLHLDYPYYPDVWPSSLWIRRKGHNAY